MSTLVKKLLAGSVLGTALLLSSPKKAYDFTLNYESKDTVNYVWETPTEEKKGTENFFLTQDSLNRCIMQAYENIKKWPKEFDRRLYRLQLRQESSFNVYAESGAGAKGLGQIMPSTWSDYRDSANYKKEVFDPVKNIEVSLEYLNDLSDFCKKKHPSWDTLNLDSKRRIILACYNGGQGKVRDAGWDLKNKELSKETIAYPDLIMKAYYNPKIKIKTDY